MSARISLSQLLLTAVVTAPALACAEPVYTIVDASRGHDSAAYAINNAGQVVGRTGGGHAGGRAFLFSGHRFTNLGTLGAATSVALGINDAGQVVGNAETVEAYIAHAFVYADHAMTKLGSMGELPYAGANGINEAGQIVGWSYNSDGNTRAVLYAEHRFQDLGTLGGDRSWAYKINNRGQIAGSSEIVPGNPDENHAFLYADGVMTDISAMYGLNNSMATALNDAGQVVGSVNQGGGAPDRAFLYADGVMTELGTLGGPYSAAYGINNLGAVVGASSVEDGVEQGHGFLYVDGVMSDLNDLIDPALGWTITDARAINESGQIAVTGCTRKDECHALRLDPILAAPEPGPTTKSMPSPISDARPAAGKPR